ncbi:MAG TPA: hypothetical protein VHX88_12530 [Solirubrobacteraceae bacterium]|nr:hypothetical protein [Solirubrobacteraceae bacterium]
MEFRPNGSADAFSMQRGDLRAERVAGRGRRLTAAEYAAHDAMGDRDEIARFHDRCSDLMRELLAALAAAPGRPRPFPEIEDAMGWPRRRIASVLGGVCRLRQREFCGSRPYRFKAPRQAASGRWEMWMDTRQARAVRDARASEHTRD